MRVEGSPLAGNSLIEGLVQEDPGTLSFFPGRPRDLEAYRGKVREVDGRFDSEARKVAASGLTGGGSDASDRLRSFVEQDGLMVTTGQQPGLFGGPLYGLYKGMTAVVLARRLEEALDRPVLPVFWIASEDHDWDEARTSYVLDRENVLQEVSLPARAGSPAPSIYRIALGPEVDEARRRFLDLHPQTEYLRRWREVIESAYFPGANLADAFQSVLDALLGPSGLFLVQAHHGELKARSLPILLRELRETAERVRQLESRSRELTGAGHPVQVPVLEGASNVFLEGPGGRERLIVDGDGFRLRASGVHVTLAEIEARARADPLALSPNVLLRPVIEGALLPTVVYVGGPAEAAYHPQTDPVFGAHGVERPIMHPRASLLLLEGKIEKVLAKIGLAVEDLALPEHEVAQRFLRDGMPPPIQEAIDGLRDAIGTRTLELQDAVQPLDPTLRGPVKSLRNQGMGLVDDLERKVVQCLRRRNEVGLAQIAKARAHLYPMEMPQERVLNPFYYLVRYDGDFLAAVEEAARAAVLPPVPSAM